MFKKPLKNHSYNILLRMDKFGFIYIFHNNCNESFIGSTENLNQTMLKCNTRHKMISFELLETIRFTDKKHLEECKQKHIEIHKPTLNTPSKPAKKAHVKCNRHCHCGVNIDFNCKQVVTNHTETTQHKAFEYILKRIYIMRSNENWTIKDCFRFNKKFKIKMNAFYRKYYDTYLTK